MLILSRCVSNLNHFYGYETPSKDRIIFERKLYYVQQVQHLIIIYMQFCYCQYIVSVFVVIYTYNPPCTGYKSCLLTYNNKLARITASHVLIIVILIAFALS